MKVIARHKWIANCLITESDDDSKQGRTAYRRFTATVFGYSNWKIFEGFVNDNTVSFVLNKVRTIKERILSGDKKVFGEK